MDKISFSLEERLKEVREHQARIMEHLQEYCDVLGIAVPSEAEINDPLNFSLFDLETAALTKPICDKCPYDVQTSQNCEHLSKFYDDYGHKSRAFLHCEKYEKYLRAKAVNARTERLLGKSGLGKRFAGRRFETFNVTADTKEAYDACVSFCDTFSEDSKGIRLVGNYGCGKTHLTASIIHRLAEQGIGGVFVVVPELLRAIRRGYNSPNEDSEKLVSLTEEAPLLVLDDLGAEKPSDWVREQLYVIINRRYENMLPTIVTTNCSTQELVDRVGQRTVSRLIEMTTPYKITAKDYRMRMA
jgi:DNA replication protein DnaC